MDSDYHHKAHLIASTASSTGGTSSSSSLLNNPPPSVGPASTTLKPDEFKHSGGSVLRTVAGITSGILGVVLGIPTSVYTGLAVAGAFALSFVPGAIGAGVGAAVGATVSVLRNEEDPSSAIKGAILGERIGKGLVNVPVMLLASIPVFGIGLLAKGADLLIKKPENQIAPFIATYATELALDAWTNFSITKIAVGLLSDNLEDQIQVAKEQVKINETILSLVKKAPLTNAVWIQQVKNDFEKDKKYLEKLEGKKTFNALEKEFYPKLELYHKIDTNNFVERIKANKELSNLIIKMLSLNEKYNLNSSLGLVGTLVSLDTNRLYDLFKLDIQNFTSQQLQEIRDDIMYFKTEQTLDRDTVNMLDLLMKKCKNLLQEKI